MILYKYKSIKNKKKAKFSQTFIRDIYFLLNNKAWFSKIDSLNDPYEGLYEINLKELDTLKLINKKADTFTIKDSKQKILNTRLELIGVLSLTLDNVNLLMWSLYTNNHQGYCIEYDFEIINFTKHNDRPLFNNNMLELREVKYSHFPFVESIYNKDKNKFLTIKSRWWEYEKEYRIISNVYGAYTHEEICIKAIYIGAKCDIAHEILLCCLASFKNIKAYKGKFFKNSFDIYFEPIDLKAFTNKFDTKHYLDALMKMRKTK